MHAERLTQTELAAVQPQAQAMCYPPAGSEHNTDRPHSWGWGWLPHTTTTAACLHLGHTGGCLVPQEAMHGAQVTGRFHNCVTGGGTNTHGEVQARLSQASGKGQDGRMAGSLKEKTRAK